jgi:uncharacterized integral membrane protein
MKRWLLLSFAALIALIGIVFSAINADGATLDLYFSSVRLPLGVLVLLSLVTGFLLGGMVLWAGVVLPLRLRLRQANRAAASAVGANAVAPRADDPGPPRR